jgi:hypothetical protein
MEREPIIGENRISEKEARIKYMERRVDGTTDKLGLHIDDGIKEAVIGFNINDIPTSQSCEGHIQERREGASYPWVEVYTPEPEGWKESDEKQREWTIENLKHRQKAMELLDEFYQDRQVPFDVRLSFANIGAFGAFRVRSAGGEIMPILSGEEQKEKLQIYRDEMNAFAKFLKDKFINS